MYMKNVNLPEHIQHNTAMSYISSCQYMHCAVLMLTDPLLIQQNKVLLSASSIYKPHTCNLFLQEVLG